MKQPTKKKTATAKIKKTKRKSVRTTKKRSHKQEYGTSKLETFFAHNFLDKLKLRYIYEYEAKEIGRYYDFAIVATMPNTEVILEEKNEISAVSQSRNVFRPLFLIEVDGEHWHPDTQKVKWEDLSPVQKHNAMVDKLKNEWCQKQHIPLLRIWEYDIRKNPKDVFKKIEETIERLSELDRIKARINKPHHRKKT